MNREQQFTTELVEIDGHTYALRPGAARVVKEALKDVERLRAHVAELEAAKGEPVVWWNCCDKTIPKALRFLADHERPIGGAEPFNAEHLFQLAGEIERMARTPLYIAPPAPRVDVDAISDKRIHAGVDAMEKNNELLEADGYVSCADMRAALRAIFDDAAMAKDGT